MGRRDCTDILRKGQDKPLCKNIVSLHSSDPTKTLLRRILLCPE